MTDTHHRELERIAAWEDFYVTLRKRVIRQVAAFRAFGPRSDRLGRFAEQLLFLPDLLHLAGRLVFDREVPAKRKGALIAGVAYVMSPIDLIPDTLPLLGWLDDLVVMTLALNHFLATVDPVMKQAIDRHWTGDRDLFELMKHVLDVGESAIEFLPNQFIKLLKPIFGEMRPGL